MPAVLTQGEHTILTPNYYVFDMYKPHRDAVLLEINIVCDQVGGKEKVAQIYGLASEKDNIITLNLINTDYSAPKLEGKKATFLLPAASVQVYQFSCA